MPETGDLLQRVRNSLAVAKSRTQYYRRVNSLAMVVSIIASALAAFFAGSAAKKASEAAADATYLSNLEVLGMGYATICGLAAVLSLFAAVSVGLQKGLNLTANLEKASSCMGSLSRLEFVATVKGPMSDEIVEEYGRIMREYPESVG